MLRVLHDMNKLFPIVPAGEPAPCFNCNAPTTNPQLSGHATRRGRWRAWCADCKMFTFFDRPSHD